MKRKYGALVLTLVATFVLLCFAAVAFNRGKALSAVSLFRLAPW